MAVNYRNCPLPEEVLLKLEESRKKASGIQTREVRCPYCRRLIAIVPAGQTDMIFAKCQKCKFDGPLDPRFFRRMKPYRSGHPKNRRKIIR